MTADPRKSCIAVATAFIAAQDDGPDRVLDRHRRLSDGHCAGCLTGPTRWPCTTAALAQVAGRLPRPPARDAPAHPEPGQHRHDQHEEDLP